MSEKTVENTTENTKKSGIGFHIFIGTSVAFGMYARGEMPALKRGVEFVTNHVTKLLSK